MLGTAKADALGAERTRQLRVLGLSALARTPSVRNSSAHSRMVSRSPVSSGITKSTAPRTTMPEVPSIEIISPSRMTRSVPAMEASLRSASILRTSTPHTQGSAHAAGDDGGVGGLSAVGGEDALGGDHARQVVGVGLPADEHALATRLGGGNRVDGREDGLADRGAGACVQAARATTS